MADATHEQVQTGAVTTTTTTTQEKTTTSGGETGTAAGSSTTPSGATQKPGGVLNQADVHGWTERINAVIAKPSETINSRSPESAASWFTGFFDCLEPIDLGVITCCLPCLTFGKTHHRLTNGGDLAGYSPLNTSCMLLCGASCCGCGAIPTALQRQHIRERYNLEGSCISDLIFSCWCNCCNLVQQDKEVEYREKLLKENPQGQYQSNAGMTYPA